MSQEISPYDFREAPSMGREHLRVLQLLHNNLAARVEKRLYQLTGQDCSVRYSKSTDASGEALIEDTSELLTCLCGLGSGPLELVIAMSGKLILKMLERFLGGLGKEAPEYRPLSEIEGRIFSQMIITPLLEDVRSNWRTFADLRPTIDQAGTTVEDLVRAGRLQRALMVRYDVKLESDDGTVVFFFNESFLRPLVPKLRVSKMLTESDNAPQHVKALLTEHLLHSPVMLRAILTQIHLSIRETQRLSVNDVLRLDARLEDPIDMIVDGVKKFKGVYGKVGDQRGVRITERVIHDSPGEE